MLKATLILITTLLAVPALAQVPAGWSVRVDRSTSASDPDKSPDVKFVTMGKGFHVTTGPAGVFWNPANTAAGDFTASATFALSKPSSHNNYYGLVFGGADLGAATQNYIYFLIGQNGSFIIKHRSGDQVHDIQAAMKSDAIKQPGADGKSSNALEVRVAGNTISYVVNGTVVHTTPKSGMTAKTDGLVGVRVNHQLDVHIDGFAVAKK
jgi:hypothetical protein